MKRVTIETHWRWFVRISLWLVCTGLSTAIVALYAGARWAALTPALWLAIFVPVVLMPIIKPSPKG
jgi:hypothetical protein